MSRSVRLVLAGGLLLAGALCLAGCGTEKRESNVLRWGADQEGGGPYVYPKEEDPTQVIGFEVDLAAALGREIGMQPEFVQCTWDQILPLLTRGNIDVALNGYEYTLE